MALKGKGILSAVQRRAISSLSELPDAEHFFLTGGTALAEFYLGHRKSYDLDLFTKESGLVLPFSRLAEDHLKKRGATVEVTRRFSSFVELEVSEKEESTRVQFALDTPFRLEDPVRSEIGLLINGYKDLIADKLQAFSGRTEARDAIDLFFILNTENLWELSTLAKEKDPGFDLYWLAVAMERTQEFPDEIERWPVEMIVPANAESIKDRFSFLAGEILDKIKKPV
ncbi:MAG: nucleotidyl transferase AbiEii/AbiGii toxin family protein [Candidatus Aminicenantales bacterium]